MDPDEGGGEAAPTASQHPRAARLFVFQDDKWQLVGAEVGCGRSSPRERAAQRTGVSRSGRVRVAASASCCPVKTQPACRGRGPRGRLRSARWEVGEQVIPELERAEEEEDRDDGWYVEVRCCWHREGGMMMGLIRLSAPLGGGLRAGQGA